MKKFLATPILLAFLLVLFSLPRAEAEQLPEFRPALIANTKRSLINAIDVQSLAKRGQGNAAVIFSCLVSKLGISFNAWASEKRSPAGCGTLFSSRGFATVIS